MKAAGHGLYDVGRKGMDATGRIAIALGGSAIGPSARRASARSRYLREASKSSPNNAQCSPSKRPSCICSIGKKSVLNARRLLHDVGAGEVVAALLEHVHELCATV